MAATPQKNPYKALLLALQNEMSTGRRRAEEALEQEKSRTYWQVGKLVDRHLLQNKSRANYGEKLYERLARDLDIHKTTLTRCVQFYKIYKIDDTGHQLSWSHFRQLLTVKNSEQRKRLEARIKLEDLTVREVREIVKESRSQKTACHPERSEGSSELGSSCAVQQQTLSFKRGRLFTYSIKEPTSVTIRKGQVLVDVGFRIFLKLTPQNKLKLTKGDTVSVEKEGDAYTFTQVVTPRAERFTYVARLLRVVDGDTLVVRLDLGFRVIREERLRLRGINSPEMNTDEGARAKRYLQNKLRNVDALVIKTYGTDMWYRYLADVFYLRDNTDLNAIAEEGNYLNQELIDAGHAVGV